MPRAAYITKAVINYDPDSDPDPITPSLKADDKIEMREEGDNIALLFVSCFQVTSSFMESLMIPHLTAYRNSGKEITRIIAIGSFSRYWKLQDQQPDWITDFEEALEKGMAIEIKLNEQQYKSGFEYIIVYGVRDNLSPDQTKQEIENLFSAHRYTEGLSLVKQGTPTNLVKTKSKDEQSFFSSSPFKQSDINKYRVSRVCYSS